MTFARLVRVAVLAALVLGQATAADACHCPRGHQAGKHGAPAQVRRDLPLPPPLPPGKAVMPAAGGKPGGG